MAPSNIIQLNDVSFAYAGEKDALALDHISLGIAPGEFVGVLGPSGAGKSTLAAVLSGAIPHHFHGSFFGAALVDGQDTCDVTLTDVSRVVGSVNQDIDAQMVASVVEDELLFGLENFGVPHNQIEARLASALDAVGIPELREREIATLSGGQKQKVAIAAMLALRPRVLVLDEPTAALDPASTKMVFDTLRDLNEREGITVVVIEQKVATLSEYCNRILVLNEGRLAFDGTPREVFSRGAKLRELGVDSPRVARVSNSLVQHGVIGPHNPCLTVEETKRLIAELVGTHPSKAAEKNRATAGVPRPRAAQSSPVVSFRGVGFTYRSTGAAVRDLTFDVFPGEVVGVVGQNGAGKTTLTKLLNGLLRPASGEVRVAGLDTRETPTSRLAAHVSTLFQNPDRQICKDTILDEVSFGLELTGVEPREARRRASSVIERFGLPADEAPFSLSRGQRQMVALASVVVMEPEVILLDEPTSGLDYRECMTVMETVSEMAAHGCAVVMVCHDMEVVSDFAERVIVMARGEIVGRGSTSEVFSDAEVMRRANVEQPQIVALSSALAADVSPAFAGITQVSEIVDLVEEMVRRD